MMARPGPDCAAPPPQWGGLPELTPGPEGQTPVWCWEARTRAGQVKKGEMAGWDADAVRERLRGLGYEPIRVKRKRRELGLGWLWGALGIITRKDRVIAARQLATMVDAGLPLVQSLDIIISQTERQPVQARLASAKRAVEAGVAPAEALRGCGLFGEAPELAGVGEAGLEAALNALASRLERRR